MDSNIVLSNLRQLVQSNDAENLLTLNSGKVWDVDKTNVNIVFIRTTRRWLKHNADRLTGRGLHDDPVAQKR